MKRYNRKDEGGAALIEFGIVLPLVLMLVFAATDLGLAIDRYLSLTRVVYEGVRYGASLPGLEVGVFTPDMFEGEGIGSSMQGRLRNRIATLLEKHGFTPQDATVTTIFVQDGGGNPDDIVAVSIQVNLDPYFPLYDSLSINVDASGPYLYDT